MILYIIKIFSNDIGTQSNIVRRLEVQEGNRQHLNKGEFQIDKKKKRERRECPGIYFCLGYCDDIIATLTMLVRRDY